MHISTHCKKIREHKSISFFLTFWSAFFISFPLVTPRLSVTLSTCHRYYLFNARFLVCESCCHCARLGSDSMLSAQRRQQKNRMDFFSEVYHSVVSRASDSIQPIQLGSTRGVEQQNVYNAQIR